MAKALLFTHQRDQVALNANDVSAFDWLYQTHVKKYRIFCTCVVPVLSGVEIIV